MIKLEAFNRNFETQYLESLKGYLKDAKKKEDRLELCDIEKNIENALGEFIKLENLYKQLNIETSSAFLDKIIIGKYKDLAIIKDVIDTAIDINGNEVFKQKGKNKKGEEVWKRKEIWERIYKKYETVRKNGDLKKIIDEHNLRVCPYCNCNMIVHRKKTVTAQMDHFFTRSKYPIFSVSLYNLIPSCQNCNFIKHENAIGQSPYDNNQDDFKFSYTPVAADYLLNPESLKIEFNKGTRIKSNIQVLKLEELYDNYNNVVVDTLKKYQLYPEERIYSLYNDFPNLFNSPDEIKDFVFGKHSEQDFKAEPFSKLKFDILRELR